MEGKKVIEGKKERRNEGNVSNAEEGRWTGKRRGEV